MADQFFEAEQQVMASILQGNDTTLLPKDLKEGPHRSIVEAALALRSDGTIPDVITVRHWISEHEGEENFGDFDYLRKLGEMFANVKRQEAYEDIIKEHALRLTVLSYARGLIHEEEAGATTADLLVMAQTEPMRFEAGDQGRHVTLAQDVAFDVLEDVQARREGDRITGVETPIRKLNELTCGLQPKDLIILAGRPSMGKTALAAQIATHAALVAGPVFIGSLEMDSSSLVERMLVGAAMVDSGKVRSGHIDQRDYEKLQTAAERLQDHHPIVVNDSPRLTGPEIRMSISQANLKHGGLKLAVVDYLGLIRDEGTSKQRYREVGEAVKLMRATAKELDIPVILVCQLNRDCEQRENKRPILADLRESGDIEQDSDVIIMLYRDEYYCQRCNGSDTEDCEKDHQGIAEAIVRKQRKGPTGTVMMTWQAEYTQFYNFERAPDGDLD